MLVSLSWLREFVPYEGTAQALGDKLTMLGLELEGISRPFDGLDPIVTGHVVACEKHPEADKLSVCQVDVGTETLTIVCGAPNVRTGLKVAVVKVGSTLPNGLQIKQAKLRGVMSSGMICSEAELGLSDDHDGIMELDATTPVGAKLVDILKLDQDILEISITPNRGDCLSILGVAREVAVAYNLPLTLPQLALVESGTDCSAEIGISIPDPALCSLYQGKIIENVTVRKSPDWLRYRLHAVGLRPISNLVDATNYILMELGQPLHAFDLAAINGKQIIVRGADQGEMLTTLDGHQRTLLPSDITIRDAKKAIALGGIMGGENSEITDTSTAVFLECANFAPSAIRRTARRLGLHSDAAYRFERGVDQCGATYAMNRAAALIAQLSGGTVRQGTPKAEPRPFVAVPVTLRHQRTEALLGISVTPDFCENTLAQLGCSLTKNTDSASAVVWNVLPPSHRPDLTREADLIEEITRIYGVDNIPAVLPKLDKHLEQTGKPEAAHHFYSRIKHWARGLGYNEAINYSFVSHKDLDLLGLPTENRISIMNPLSDEQNVLRTELTPGLLHSLRTNISQGASGIRLFEVAMSFTADATSETTAKETARLAFLLHGLRFDSPWMPKQAELDYLDLKGAIEHLAQSFYLPQPEFTRMDSSNWLAPALRISIGETTIGFAGKVKPSLADVYHAKKAVWVAELDLHVLYTMHLAAKPKFVPLPVFPPVRRDITCIAAPQVTCDAILDVINSLSLPLLEKAHLIDYFMPDGAQERNLTFRLTFRHNERTLKDNEADKQRDAIVTALTKALAVRI